MRGLTRTLALELGQYGITVNDVCPNVTNGGRMDRIVAEKATRPGRTPEEVYADFAAQTALGRFVDESDVAEAVTVPRLPVRPQHHRPRHPGRRRLGRVIPARRL